MRGIRFLVPKHGKGWAARMCREKNVSTKMYVMTETSVFMMSYVLVTSKGNCIIVDGGRPEDIPLLREKVKGHPIKAWFLTHPHVDHITAFVDLVKKEDPDFVFEKVYYNFPSEEFVRRYEAVEEQGTLLGFNALLPVLGDRAQIVHTGDVITVDEVTIEILYHFEESYPFIHNSVNNTSIAFRADTPRSSVIFLGDLGPEAGDILAKQGEEKLRAEYCQMAHHGHSGVGADVYILINPRVCMWNAPDWLWEEPGDPVCYRGYGVKRTRLWMERIGVKEHIVTKDGTAEVDL